MFEKENSFSGSIEVNEDVGVIGKVARFYLDELEFTEPKENAETGKAP